MRKGIELPINVLVILVIAVIVLITLILLVISPPSLNCDTAKAGGCLKMIQDCEADPSAIPVDDFNYQGNVIDDLQDVCTHCYGKATTDECRELCGCQITPAGAE